MKYNNKSIPVIQGAGGGGKGSPKIDENSLFSTDILFISNAIGEGPVYRINPNGPQDIQIQDSSIDDLIFIESDGTENTEKFKTLSTTGTTVQGALTVFGDAIVTPQNFSSAVTLKKGNINGVPSSSITLQDTSNSAWDIIAFNFVVSRLFKGTDKGDILSYSVGVKINIYDDTSSTIIASTSRVIKGKTDIAFKFTIRMIIPEAYKSANGYKFSVEKTTNDSDDAKISDDIKIVGWDEIENSKQAYPRTALIGYAIKATDEHTGGVPNFTSLVKGLLVKVPSNYNQPILANGEIDWRQLETAKHIVPEWLFVDNNFNDLVPIMALDFKNEQYSKNYTEASFSDVLTYSRSGTTWAWQLVSGNLELVEIPDSVVPFSVDPVTGKSIGVDVLPAVTRNNIVYAPTASQFTTSGGGVIDYSLNTLGQFPSTLVYSTGSITDTISTIAADNVTLSAGLKYSFSMYLTSAALSTSPTIRFGLRGVSGNTSYIEFTFTNAVISNPITTAGIFTDLRADKLLDGTYRITGIFSPNTTEAYGLDLLPYSSFYSSGFIMSAWFIHYWSSQLKGFPTPVLGNSGSTNSTYRAKLTGSLNISGDRTIVMFREREMKYSNWDLDFEWLGGTTDSISIGNRHDYKNFTFISNGTTKSAYTSISYGSRTGLVISYNEDTVRFGIFDEVTPLKYVETSSIPIVATNIFGIGCSTKYGVTIGGTYEKVLFFDRVLTEIQIKDIIQRGY